MIIEKLLSAILSLPFFKNLNITDEAVNAIYDMMSFFGQAYQIVNFAALVEAVITVLGAYMIAALIRVVIDLL